MSIRGNKAQEGIDGSYQIANGASIDLVCGAIPADYATSVDFLRALVSGVPVDVAITQFSPSSISYPYYVISGYLDGYGGASENVTLTWTYGWTEYSLLEGWHWHEVTTSKIVRMTSSPSGNYLKVVDPITIPGEIIPSNIAYLIYQSRRFPLHAGSFSKELTAVKSITTTQNNISITGGLAEYETMRAPVQSVSRDWFGMDEKIKFGYPTQAGIRDFIDQLRVNRSVNRPSRRTWAS